MELTSHQIKFTRNYVKLDTTICRANILTTTSTICPMTKSTSMFALVFELYTRLLDYCISAITCIGIGFNRLLDVNCPKVLHAIKPGSLHQVGSSTVYKHNPRNSSMEASLWWVLFQMAIFRIWMLNDSFSIQLMTMQVAVKRASGGTPVLKKPSKSVRSRPQYQRVRKKCRLTGRRHTWPMELMLTISRWSCSRFRPSASDTSPSTTADWRTASLARPTIHFSSQRLTNQAANHPRARLSTLLSMTCLIFFHAPLGLWVVLHPSHDLL